MGKKKIAILATYVGVIDRGVETFVIEFTTNLRNDFDITVFSMGISEEIKENTIKVNVRKSIFLKVHKIFYYKINYYKKLCDKLYYLIPSEIEQYIFSKQVYKEFLSKMKFDLIFPNNGIQGIRYAKIIRDLNKTPFMYTGHGGNSKGEILILKHKPNLYIALTERYLKWAEMYYSQVVKINNGVNVERFTKNFMARKEHETIQRPIVLCVGALIKMKRQKLLIDAMQMVEKGFLILIGDGEEKQRLESYCREKIPGKYLIMNVSRDEIAYYYYLCDLFSLPSKDEPFGVVYLEAMACNKPIVTTKDVDRKEIVGDAGILCDVENSSEYAKAIIECYNKQWSDIPKQRAINNFSWKKIIKVYENTINSITK